MYPLRRLVNSGKDTPANTAVMLAPLGKPRQTFEDNYEGRERKVDA